NNVHSSSGTNRSTRSVMHGSTSDHAIRNGVLGPLRQFTLANSHHRPAWTRTTTALRAAPPRTHAPVKRT
ncbi:hypothetical protein ACIO7M_33105, partial [Streptomyces toxytricini]